MKVILNKGVKRNRRKRKSHRVKISDGYAKKIFDSMRS